MQERLWCDHNYPRWGGHFLFSYNFLVFGAPASLIGSELSGLFGSDPSLCPAPMALGRLDRDYAELRIDGVLLSSGFCYT